MRLRKSLSVILGALLLTTSHGKVITKPEGYGAEAKDIKMTPVGVTTFHIISGQLPPLKCPEITAEQIEPTEMKGEVVAMLTQDIQHRLNIIYEAQRPIPTLSGNPFMGGSVQGQFLPPHPEGVLVFLLENPIMWRIHMSAVSSGIGPKPKPLKVEDMPMWCDVILYFHPKQVAVLFEPYLTPPPTYPTIVKFPNSDFALAVQQILYRIGSEVTQIERDMFSRLVGLYNSIVNSFFDSVKTYTPTITYQIAGRQGQISVDLHWFINDYSARLHNARKFMTSEDIQNLQYFTYIILAGYRAKGVKYPKDLHDIAIVNMYHIANLQLFSVPMLPQTDKIRLWIMPEGLVLYPALNPTITKFLSQTPFSLGSPRSVLDVPVLLHLINTHDFSQDTLFTRFIVAYFQNSPMPKVDSTDVIKLFEKLKAVLSPKQENRVNSVGNNLDKQLGDFMEKMLEYRKRITQ